MLKNGAGTLTKITGQLLSVRCEQYMMYYDEFGRDCVSRQVGDCISA